MFPPLVTWKFCTICPLPACVWPIPAEFTTQNWPSLPAPTTSFVPGTRRTPADPRSMSPAFNDDQLSGVNQSSTVDRFGFSLRMVWPKFLLPSKEPLPVARYRFPEASTEGGWPDCQIPPHPPFGVTQNTPICWSVDALSAMTQLWKGSV